MFKFYEICQNRFCTQIGVIPGKKKTPVKKKKTTTTKKQQQRNKQAKEILRK